MKKKLIFIKCDKSTIQNKVNLRHKGKNKLQMEWKRITEKELNELKN